MTDHRPYRVHYGMGMSWKDFAKFDEALEFFRRMGLGKNGDDICNMDKYDIDTDGLTEEQRGELGL